MRFLLAFLALPLCASIDGTVINKTTSRPQSGVTVTLTQLGQGGMTPAGSVKSDANGRFTLEGDAANAHLLQASYKGVTYSTTLNPGASAAGIELLIYESSSAQGSARVDQHIIFVETDGQDLVVNETVTIKNDGLTTWTNPATGTLRFHIPEPARQQMRVRAMSPNGMPVERTPLKGPANIFYVDFPVKPGETRFDISYKMPAPSPLTLAGRILHKEGQVRLVVPPGMSAEGAGLKTLGTEPTSKASVYDIAVRDYKITLTGSGAMKPVEATARGEEDGPRIEPIDPRIYGQLYWILGLSLAVLALAFVSHYRKGSGRQA